MKTKAEFVRWFRETQMPAIREREGIRVDNPLRAETWNNVTDMMVRSGELPEAALAWTNPFDQRRETLLTRRASREIEIAARDAPIRDEFVRRVALAAVNVPIAKAFRLARELRSLARESARLAELACNRELTLREDARDTELDARVKAIGEQLGLRAYRQGDPRGWTIRVEVGKRLANSWDGLTTGCG